jgi:ribosomal protein S18 acetylase RimI-like enzyme
MTDHLTARPVLDFTSAEVTEAMNRSFEEYFVPLVFTPETFERRFRSENLDAAASRLWFRDGELVRAARGQGYGRHMLQAAIDEATARGDRDLLLEVFQANEPARRLYERLGFRNVRELFTFQPAPGPAPSAPAPPLTELDPLAVARLVARKGRPDLPWMFAAESLAAAAAPARAFHLAGKAYVILRPEPTRTLVLTVLVRPEHRRQGWGRRLLQALAAAYPGPPLTISMVTSGSAYDFLRAVGWEPGPLPLLEMVRPLGA